MNPVRPSESVATAVPRQQQTVLWIIAILLAIIATVLVMHTTGVSAVQRSFADSPMVGARGVFAFTGQIDKNRYGLFMLDVDSSNVWCYEYLPGTRKLKLVAARSFRWDRYLENYNNEEPAPEVVKKMLREQSRIKERINGGGIAPNQEEDEEALGTDMSGVAP
jgi:hypothetical protein